MPEDQEFVKFRCSFRACGLQGLRFPILFFGSVCQAFDMESKIKVVCLQA